LIIAFGDDFGRLAFVGGRLFGGLGISRRFAQLGHPVAMLDLQPDALAREGAALAAAGAKMCTCTVDVSQREQVDAAYARVRRELGPISIVIANAAIARTEHFLSITTDSWQRLLDVNLTGVFHTLQAAVPDMVQGKWGRIVTLGGIAWHVGFANRANNLTAKAGLTGLTRALAAEFGGRGITANTVSPGMVETVRPASAGALPPMKTPPPVPRFATVDEIASAVHFLCLPDQGYLTGQIIHVNGGMYYGG